MLPSDPGDSQSASLSLPATKRPGVCLCTVVSFTSLLVYVQPELAVVC